MNYSKYHPDWKDIIRPGILQRDNYKCQHCNVPHKSKVYKKSNGDYHVCDDFEFEWAKANDKKPYVLSLHVAHLDHDKTNNDASNLLALCPKCHARYDREHKKLMRKVYSNKSSRQNFKDDFKLKRKPDEVKAYIRQRFSWVIDGAPSGAELNNLVRYIINS